MIIEQIDVTTAYLNGVLEQVVYMEVPEMTEDILEHITRTEPRGSNIHKGAENMLRSLRTYGGVCLLKKALYGLRQAGRQWFKRLDQELKNLGVVQSCNDPCVYYRGQGGDVLIIIVYVDDILIASRNLSRISQIKTGLKRSFVIRELGEANCCLGLEFLRHKDGYSIHQRGYIEEVLNRFGMGSCRPVSAPIEGGMKLRSSTNRDALQRLPYRELIGSLMYLAVATRPDIAHAVSWLSQFVTCYDETHWAAGKRVLRYLRGTSGLGLTYRRSQPALTGYVDADWGNCTEERRSYTGYVFIVAGGAVTWESRKQRTVALSSTEAEYMGIAEAVKEVIYLRRFLIELGSDDLAAATLFSDNMGAQKLVANPVFHSRTKHIDIRHHFVRDAVRDHNIQLKYASTDNMVADVLTKGLSGPKHQKCLHMMGQQSRSPRDEGECWKSDAAQGVAEDWHGDAEMSTSLSVSRCRE